MTVRQAGSAVAVDHIAGTFAVVHVVVSLVFLVVASFFLHVVVASAVFVVLIVAFDIAVGA